MAASSIARTAGAASQLVIQSHVPSGIAPTGTVAANGAITLGTALSKVYANGIFLRFPAGALFAASPAGSYWCVMSSTTVGTAFNNTLSGLPAIPASTTAIVDAGPGAYTGVTTIQAMMTTAVPGGSMGPNGATRFNVEYSYNLTVGAKAFALNVAGSAILTSTRTSAGGHDSFTNRLRNNGATNKNTFYGSSESSGASTTGYSGIALDTSIDMAVLLNLTIATATDWGIVESIAIEILPGY
jgi:hypothetical protein